ncbi:hypothetical protein HGO34_15785 [Agrobacterium vitis]|uniref:Hint domain-containing protein n=1 Tax=Agrobacterium vitis TaxID=373 RepID=UPI001F37C692|nr:LAGLIDADG family homing endonuclease [Agrobacterium vitis]MCF1498915.1 hypothetical protein [Allorhizobium sp. Av2]MCM2441183.1 hypothetical protein [Agrobacterium vitis]
MNLDDVLAAFGALDEDQKDELKAMALAQTGQQRFVPNPGPQTEAWFSEADELFYGGGAGGGKRLDVDTPVPTPSGWTTMGDLVAGDTIFSSDGSQTRVLAVSPILQADRSFEVEFDTGEVIYADGDHLWLTESKRERDNAIRLTEAFRVARRESRLSRRVEVSKKPWVSAAITAINASRVHDYKLPSTGSVRTTDEIAASLLSGKSANHAIAVAKPLDIDAAHVPIDPYLLGLWLGDGYSAGGLIGMDVDDMSEILPHISSEIVSRRTDTVGRKRPFEVVRFAGLQKQLRCLGILGDKRIPLPYLRAGFEQRCDLLRGLMDTDGTVDRRGQCEIALSKQDLIDDVHHLLSTLGIKCTVRTHKVERGNTSFRIKFVCPWPVFKLRRKRDRQKMDGLRTTTLRRYIVDVRPCAPRMMRCIAVDHSSKLYLVGRSCIPTHNTTLIIGLATEVHKNSLVFRRNYKQISGLEQEAARILGSRDGYNSQLKQWKLGAGRMMEFGGLQLEKDKENYQGRQNDLKAWDEITQFTETQFRYVNAWNRDAGGGRCRIVATGNPPTTPQGQWVIKYWGPWLDKNHKNPAAPGELRWFTTIDGEDTEVDGRGPHFVNGEWVDAVSRTFIPSRLEDNPDLMQTGYAARLNSLPKALRERLRAGSFDVEEEDDEWQVFPTSWLRQAQARWTTEPPAEVPMTAIAVDVAQGGNDRTVLQARYDWWYGRPESHPGKDTPDGPTVAGLIVRKMRDRCRIIVDAGGGYGGDTLTQLAHADLNCFGFKGGSGSASSTRDGMYGFFNARAQAIWQFREQLDPNFFSKIALPPDEELIADLAAYRFEIVARGQKEEIIILPKEEMKELLGRSPDKGDTTIMLSVAKMAGLKRPKAAQERRDQKLQSFKAKTSSSALKDKLRGKAR